MALAREWPYCIGTAALACYFLITSGELHVLTHTTFRELNKRLFLKSHEIVGDQRKNTVDKLSTEGTSPAFIAAVLTRAAFSFNISGAEAERLSKKRSREFTDEQRYEPCCSSSAFNPLL